MTWYCMRGECCGMTPFPVPGQANHGCRKQIGRCQELRRGWPMTTYHRRASVLELGAEDGCTCENTKIH